MPRKALSRFTGLFRGWGILPQLPHDPSLVAWAGQLPRWGADGSALAVGGIGLDEESASGSALGEAVERWQARPMPCDRRIWSSFADWPLDEPAVPPTAWVLFHPDQYSSEGFPYRRFTEQTMCHWVCCRDGEGEPMWVPEAFVYLSPDMGDLAPSISTGLSAGRVGIPLIRRGLQEVIERDALVGAWWGHYLLEEHQASDVFSALPGDLASRIIRPNLTWRFHRVRTPYSAHVTLASVLGPDPAPLFSIGSSCRETRQASWVKSILEAVQGRYYVRHLLAQPTPPTGPVNFAGHAAYYSLHPEALSRTPLARSVPQQESCPEARLPGPVLIRILTPPGLAPEWTVVRVVVPGMQPLHSNHSCPFLGGPHWGRSVAEYARIPPHPFP